MSQKPTRIYKFMPAKYALSSIARRELKVARYSELNDPFELLAYDMENEKLRNSFKNLIKEADALKGIISFSLTRKNPVLWAHYADAHKGVCLGFDYYEDPSEPTLERIKYHQERLAAHELIKSLQAGRRDGWKILGVGISAKFKHWAYERERRLVVELSSLRVTEDPEMYFMPFDTDLNLREVIVGCKNIDLTRDSISDALASGEFAENEVECWKARPAFKKFEIVRNRDESLWT